MENVLIPYWTTMAQELISKKKLSIARIAELIYVPEDEICRIVNDVYFEPAPGVFIKLLCLYQKVFFLSNKNNKDLRKRAALSRLVKSTDLPEGWLEQQL